MDLPIGTYHTIIPINSTYLPRYSTHHKHEAVSAISVRVTLLKGDCYNCDCLQRPFSFHQTAYCQLSNYT